MFTDTVTGIEVPANADKIGDVGTPKSGTGTDKQLDSGTGSGSSIRNVVVNRLSFRTDSGNDTGDTGSGKLAGIDGRIGNGNSGGSSKRRGRPVGSGSRTGDGIGTGTGDGGNSTRSDDDSGQGSGTSSHATEAEDLLGTGSSGRSETSRLEPDFSVIAGRKKGKSEVSVSDIALMISSATNFAALYRGQHWRASGKEVNDIAVPAAKIINQLDTRIVEAVINASAPAALLAALYAYAAPRLVQDGLEKAKSNETIRQQVPSPSGRTNGTVPVSVNGTGPTHDNGTGGSLGYELSSPRLPTG